MKLFWLGYDKAATILIQKGADVNVVGKYGKTALIEAANKGKQMFGNFEFSTVAI